MNQIFKNFILLLFLSSAVIACKSSSNDTNNEQQNQLSEEDRDSLLPFSTGKVNNLYVYLDPSYKTGPLKDSLFYHFQQPYLLTPSPSSVLDLSTYDFSRFSSGKARTANNLVVVNLSEENEISSFVKSQLGEQQINQALADKDVALVRVKNVNAKPQQVFYLLTKSYPNTSSPVVINQLKDYIQSVIEESLALDNQRLVSSFSARRSRLVEDKIEEEFGIGIWAVRDYETMIEEDDLFWLLRETSELYSSILIYRSDKYNDLPLIERVLPLRADLGKYVETNREGSYMTTNTENKPYPIQREIEVDGKTVIETRGLWGMHNDYLGGGFVNYTLENNNGETISIDGFVFYSEDDVRRKMRDIDALMSTVRIPQ